MKKETKADRRNQLYDRLRDLGFTYAEITSLRRIEMTLSRWGAMECGDEFGRCIERDEKTGKPMISYETGGGDRTKPRPFPDKEKGALKRMRAIISARNARAYVNGRLINPVSGYHQTDPRGCALYIVPHSVLEAPENQIVRLAKEKGALICKRDTSTGPIVAGQIYYTLGTNTDQHFDTPEAAARRYLIDNKHCDKDRMPSRNYTIDQVYNQGVAVCY